MTGSVVVNGVRIAYRFDGPPGGRVVLMSLDLCRPLKLLGEIAYRVRCAVSSPPVE